uniref:Lysosomal acid phosphatase n=1 Tax=Lygus hesperus TaxID=30085 RepID=A0A0A9VR30_LYGHE
MWNSNSFLVQQCRKKKYTFITVVSLAVILVAFFITFASFSGSKPLPTLRQINVVFRHGDRTPTYTYPNDPHKDFVWKDGKGALTAKGKFELFSLGEIIRSKYGEFLGKVYRPEEVQMKSSYAPRAQMSAMTFLAGLFPPTGYQIWNENLHWQPIPVNPIPRVKDNILAAKAYCAKFEREKRNSDASIAQNLSKEDNELLKFLTEKTGDQISNISKAESLYYTLQIQRDNKLQLPAWSEEVFPSRLAHFAGLNLASYTQTDTLKRFQAGITL